MLARPKVVRSPGWDPGHHEELRKWSGGKDLYMESGFQGSGKSSVFSVLYREASGSCCSGGSTGWVHLPRRPTWAEGGRPGLHGPGAPAPQGPCGQGLGKTLGVEAPPLGLGAKPPPRGHPPHLPWRRGQGWPAPSLTPI